jgi:hypothetical protein
MRVGLGMDMTCPTPLWAWTSMHESHVLGLESAPQVQYAWVQAARLDLFLTSYESAPNNLRACSLDSKRVS